MMDLAPDHGEKAVCDERLWAFLQGDVDPAEALLIATHCCLCSEVATRLKQLMSCAASVMEEAETHKMRCTGAEFFERNCMEAKTVTVLVPVISNVPRPLQSLCGQDFDLLPWRQHAPGWERIDFVLDGSRMSVAVHRIAAGFKVPAHHHPDGEIALIVSGVLRDGDAIYKKGDVSVHRADTIDDQHTPEALEHCICLVVRGK